MTRIFISYRRSDDPGSVGRVHDRLRLAYGERAVFRDIDSIPAGTRFAALIAEQMASCDVLLIIIGPDWLNVTDSRGERRLDQPEDSVRTEIEFGLRRAATTSDLRIMPVLVGGASIPEPTQLPESIRSLLEWDAAKLRDDSFDDDFDKLVGEVGGRHWRPLLLRGLVAAVCVAAIVATVIFFTRLTTTPSREAGPMSGAFNIAVAKFSTPVSEREADAAGLAKQLTSDLRTALAEDATFKGDRHEVRGPEVNGPLEGSDGEAAARDLARKINAHIVVYGVLNRAGTQVTPQAFVSENGLGSNPELAGRYALGRVSSSTTFGGPLPSDELSKGLGERTSVLVQFVKGVYFYERAAQTFADADRQDSQTAFTQVLQSRIPSPEIQEDAHVFLGALGLLASDLETAQKEFTAARALKKDDPRAKLGLAEVLQLRNSRGLCMPGTVNAVEMRKAAHHFQSLQANRALPFGTKLKAMLSEARALRCLGQAGLATGFGPAKQLLDRIVSAEAKGRRQALDEVFALAHSELALLVAPAADATDSPDRTRALEQALAQTRHAVKAGRTAAEQAPFRLQAAFYLNQLGRTDEAQQALDAAKAQPSYADVLVTDLTAQTTGRLVPSATQLPQVVVQDASRSATLPFTGHHLLPPLVLGLALVLAGVVLTYGSRRSVRPRHAGAARRQRTA